jgi:mannose-6-phosphate isomerase class I
MGTHPSGPACAKANQLLLSSILDAQPDMVGKVPDGYPTNDLPFLFKVLSVRLALSIQVCLSTSYSLTHHVDHLKKISTLIFHFVGSSR